MSRLLPLAMALAALAGCFVTPAADGPYQCLDDGTCGDSGLTCDDGICCRPGGTPMCPSYINADGTCPGGGEPTYYFQDLDGDGYGNEASPKRYCIPPVTVPYVLAA